MIPVAAVLRYLHCAQAKNPALGEKTGLVSSARVCARVCEAVARGAAAAALAAAGRTTAAQPNPNAVLAAYAAAPATGPV